MIKKILSFLIILMLASGAIALSAPTTRHAGFILYGQYIDLNGAQGITNGSISGNMTFNGTFTGDGSGLTGISGTSYNATYAGTTAMVDSNLAAWNSTYNATYDALVAGSSYNATYEGTTNAVNANLATWNSTYNATYDAKPSTTFNSSYDALLTNAPNTSLINYLLISTYADNFPNSTVAGHVSSISTLQINDTVINASISALQSNDTTDRTYVNNTFLPISTYADNFPNSSLSNYVLTSLYSGDFPNSTVSSNLVAWNATYNSTYDATTATVNANTNTWNATYNGSYSRGGFNFIIDGGGSAIIAGEHGNVSMIYSGTITRVKVVGDQTGNATISIYNGTTDMTGGNNIVLSNQQNLTDSTLTGWTTAIDENTVLKFNSSSMVNFTRLSIAITITKT